MTSWLLIQLFWATFPADHAWKVSRKGKRFTLKEWKERRTDLCKQLDFQFAFIFWMMIVCGIIVLIVR